MASTLRKQVRERIALLEAEGYTDVHAEQTHAGHHKLWFTHEGTKYYVICSGGSTDVRSPKQMLRDAKLLVTGVFTQRHTK